MDDNRITANGLAKIQRAVRPTDFIGTTSVVAPTTIPDPIATRAIQLWMDTQAQSKALSDRTTQVFNALPTTYALGEGSQSPGTFVSNGNPPSY